MSDTDFQKKQNNQIFNDLMLTIGKKIMPVKKGITQNQQQEKIWATMRNQNI